MMLSRHRHAVLVNGLEQRAAPLAASAHFQLYALTAAVPTDELIIVHDFSVAQIDNNLGYYVVSELLPLLAAQRHRIDSCLLYTSPSPRDGLLSRMPSSA